MKEALEDNDFKNIDFLFMALVLFVFWYIISELTNEPMKHVEIIVFLISMFIYKTIWSYIRIKREDNNA